APALPAVSHPSSASTGAAPTGPQEITITGNLGAPVDLWDTDWPSSGFYWTVVAVQAFSPGALTSSTATTTAIGATSISAVSTGFAAGDSVTIGTSSNQESATVVSANGSTLTLAAALKFAHGVGEPVVRTGGSLQYRDLELPQDVCAAPYDRVARFGKNSEPSLTSAGELFA